MSESVSFVTRGLIDPRCITVIGVSVKESENPIGQFGTGLKYAISIVLRAGGEITIWRGLEPLRFTTKPVVIRGKSVDMVCMNEQELGFTTDLGKHWQMWQAFREIFSNTKDEGGDAYPGLSDPAEDHTTVQVTSYDFSDAYRNRDRYFLASAPVHETDCATFHPERGNSIFYRGIQVAVTDRPWRYRPNVTTKLTLTEDRSLLSESSFRREIAKAVVKSTDEQFIERWITTPNDYMEHHLSLDWGDAPSEEFLAVARKVAADPSRKKNPSVSAILRRHETPVAPKAATLLPSEKAALSEAVEFCKRLGYEVDEYPIMVVESLGQHILGMADRDLREIFLAKACFQMGDLMLASTLIEEWAHIKHGHEDYSVEMQNWAFGELVRMGKAYLHSTECV